MLLVSLIFVKWWFGHHKIIVSKKHDLTLVNLILQKDTKVFTTFINIIYLLNTTPMCTFFQINILLCLIYLNLFELVVCIKL